MRYSPRAQTMISFIQSVWCSMVSKYGLSLFVSLIDHFRIIESRPAVYNFELNGHHRIAFTPERFYNHLLQSDGRLGPLQRTMSVPLTGPVSRLVRITYLERDLRSTHWPIPTQSHFSI